MFGFLFALARMASAAWVGAAVLFVLVAVPQAKALHDQPEIQNRLALLRFPPYYVMGGILIGTALIASLPLRQGYLRFGRWMLVVSCLAGAAGLMAYDWKMVYTPLVGMITPPDRPRPEGFTTLHRHSEVVNGTEVALVFVAAMLLCWPGTRPTQRTIMMSPPKE